MCVSDSDLYFPGRQLDMGRNVHILDKWVSITDSVLASGLNKDRMISLSLPC